MHNNEHTKDFLQDWLNDDNDDNHNSNRKIFEDLKKEDKGYYTWKVNVPGIAKPVKIEGYGSGDTGSRIRDPITGDRYTKHLVGSRYEDLFFKVKMCSFQFNGRDPPTFFYSGPDEYEKHSKTTLSAEVKAKWSEKKSKMELQLLKESEKKHEQRVIVH